MVGAPWRARSPVKLGMTGRKPEKDGAAVVERALYGGGWLAAAGRRGCPPWYRGGREPYECSRR